MLKIHNSVLCYYRSLIEPTALGKKALWRQRSSAHVTIKIDWFDNWLRFTFIPNHKILVRWIKCRVLVFICRCGLAIGRYGEEHQNCE